MMQVPCAIQTIKDAIRLCWPNKNNKKTYTIIYIENVFDNWNKFMKNIFY